MAEDIIPVVSEINKQKEFSKTQKEWHKQAREAGKVYCQTCARRDFDRNEMRSNWEEYSGGFKETNRVKLTLRNSKTGEVSETGVMIDYECPKGHGISVEWNTGELKKIEK